MPRAGWGSDRRADCLDSAHGAHLVLGGTRRSSRAQAVHDGCRSAKERLYTRGTTVDRQARSEALVEWVPGAVVLDERATHRLRSVPEGCRVKPEPG